jgi:hypothetical protein
MYPAPPVTNHATRSSSYARLLGCVVLPNAQPIGPANAISERREGSSWTKAG